MDKIIGIGLGDMLRATKVVNLLMDKSVKGTNVKNLILRNNKGVLEVIGTTSGLSGVCTLAHIGELPEFADVQFVLQEFLTVLAALNSSTKTVVDAIQLHIGEKRVLLTANEYMQNEDGTMQLLEGQSLEWSFPVIAISLGIQKLIDIGDVFDLTQFQPVEISAFKFVLDQVYPRLPDSTNETGCLVIYDDYSAITPAKYKLLLRDVFNIVAADDSPLIIQKRGVQFLRGVLGLTSSDISTVYVRALDKLLYVVVDNIRIIVRSMSNLKHLNLTNVKVFDKTYGFAVNRLWLLDALKLCALSDDDMVTLNISEGCGVSVTQYKSQVCKVIPATVKGGSAISIDCSISLLQLLIIKPDLDEDIWFYMEFMGTNRSQVRLTVTDASQLWFSKFAAKCVVSAEG